MTQLSDPYRSLSGAACAVLNQSEPADKIALTSEVAALWRQGELNRIGGQELAGRPSRPDLPQLLLPRDMPRRRLKGEKGRIALMHAIAHIELNAIDLAWDIVARFHGENMPSAFYDDWITVAEDEARHFELTDEYLRDLGAAYGNLPVHDGLWEAAESTSDDLLARLAIVPMVLEARGLDTMPTTIKKLHDAGDYAGAEVLEEIAHDEIAHVAAGVRWFDFLCDRRGLDPATTFQKLVRARFKGQVKPPFASDTRAQAGFKPEYYEPLA